VADQTAFQPSAFQNTAFQIYGAVILDTHDGDYHKKLKSKFDKEQRSLRRKKKDIIAAYERIVEGRPDIAAEIVKGYEKPLAATQYTDALQPANINFDSLINNLDRMDQLWNEAMELDDEDILVLL